MDRMIETALGQVGDFAGAALWREAERALNGELRVLVLGTHAPSVAELVSRLGEAAHGQVLGDEGPPVRALAGHHAVLWATAANQPLPQSEREWLDELADLLPPRAGVATAYDALLDALSDEPERERAAIAQRLARRVPVPWTAVEAPVRWVEDLEEQPELRPQARRQLARRLLRDARADADLALAQLVSAHDGAARDAAQAADALAEAERIAQRHERVLRDAVDGEHRHLAAALSAFVRELELSLPGELAAVDDLDDMEHILPAWLDEAVSTWLHDACRASAERLALALDGLADPELPTRVQPQAPATAPLPLQTSPSWTHRLAVSGAVGGGLAVAVAGWWGPGLLVATAGATVAALHPLRRGLSGPALHEAAVRALRHTGRDIAQRLERQQQRAVERVADSLQAELLPLREQLRQCTERTAVLAARRDARQAELLAHQQLLDARLRAVENAS